MIWGELPICAALLALGAVETWILARPAEVAEHTSMIVKPLARPGRQRYLRVNRDQASAQLRVHLPTDHCDLQAGIRSTDDQ